MRYRILDTIHTYVHEKLAASGEEAVLRDRHFAYLVHFVEQVMPRLKSAEHPECLYQLEAERMNLRSAMSWALVESDSMQGDSQTRIEMGLHIGNGLAYFWDSNSPFRGVINWMSDGLAKLDALGSHRTALHARTLNTLGYTHGYESNDFMRRSLMESISLFRECGDLPNLSLALLSLEGR